MGFPSPKIIRRIRLAGQLLVGMWIILMLLAAVLAAAQDYHYHDTLKSLGIAGLSIVLWVTWMQFCDALGAWLDERAGEPPD